MEEKELEIQEINEIEIQETAQTETGETSEPDIKKSEGDISELSKEELEQKVREDRKKERKANLIEWVKDIVIAAILATIILSFIKPIIVEQESMLDNFLPGDYIIISRQAYNIFGDPERGDVIVFKTDMDDGMGGKKNLIKRIVGLPGDRVEVRDDGYVYINGELLDEPYLKEQGISNLIAGTVDVTVGEGELFVCGDNRGVSLDSRAIGCIDQDQIMGKVKFKVFNVKGNKLEE